MPNLRLIGSDDRLGDAEISNETLNSLTQIPTEVTCINEFRDRVNSNLFPDDDPRPPVITALAA